MAELAALACLREIVPWVRIHPLRLSEVRGGKSAVGKTSAVLTSASDLLIYQARTPCNREAANPEAGNGAAVAALGCAAASRA